MWPPVAADLYIHGAPESYFAGVSGGTITAAILGAMGQLSRKVQGRAGGPASSWTWTDPTGQEEATRDVCVVAAAALSFTQGLVLPVQQTVDGDRTFNDRARAVEAMWSDMGASKAPLYSGLVDTTVDVIEGKSRGWYTPLGAQADGVEA
jgi:hypothetical protein